MQRSRIGRRVFFLMVTWTVLPFASAESPFSSPETGRSSAAVEDSRADRRDKSAFQRIDEFDPIAVDSPFDPAESASGQDGVDPSAEPAVAGVDDSLTCEVVASFTQAQGLPSRFRGNIFSVASRGRLQRFGFELQFTGQTDLYFSIFRRPQVFGATFQRALTPDIIVRAIGNNMRERYSTAAAQTRLNFDIFPGFEYLLAVAWDDTAVAMSRDGSNNSTRPPYSHGRLLGLVSVNLANTQEGGPPIQVDPEIGLNVGPSTDGANLMDLCFEPEPGACCCVGELRCDLLVKQDCENAGGYFQGERTRCTQTPCRCGACCLPCRGECRNDVEEIACLFDEKGTFKGVGSQCAQVPSCPVATGACCLPGGVCRELCEEECTEKAGVFRRDTQVSDCDPNPCQGACCFNGNLALVPPQLGICLDLQQSFCSAAMGSFSGAGSSCATVTPAQECGGACCIGSPGSQICVGDRTREECAEAFPNPRYLGDGTGCTTSTTACQDPDLVTLSFGACCLRDGLCVVAPQDFCNAAWVNGVYLGLGSVCGSAHPAVCQNLMIGACCLPDGRCLQKSEPDCTASGGMFREGVATCSVAPAPPTCPQPTGACCNASQQCVQNQTKSACEMGGGTYRGNSSTCPAQYDCPGVVGACCFDDGSCSQIASTQCTAMGGEYEGDEISCATADCPSAQGACCLADASCAARTASRCRAENGIYRGDDTTCQAGTCLGACCLVDDMDVVSCERLGRTACVFNNGEFQGVDSMCQDVSCAELTLGACCDEMEDCTLRTEESCALRGGLYRGDGSICDPFLPCFPLVGACCFADGDCEVLGPSSCRDQLGEYQGHNSPCTFCPPPAPTGGCCLPDGRCVEISAAGCAARDGEYVGDDSDCSPNPCDPPTNDVCTQATPLSVPGTATGTTENTGFRGACCRPAVPSGTRCELLSPSACAAITNSTYFGNESVCEGTACPDQPIGSCLGQIINSPGVWYTVVGTGNTMTASLCGDVTGFDTKLNVYCRECESSLCVASNDDGCGGGEPVVRRSEVSWCSEAGQVYRILVHGFNGEVGPFELAVTSDQIPCTGGARCRRVGACCNIQENCVETSEAECLAMGRFYDGDDTTCPCDPPPTGACCDDGDCQVLDRNVCLSEPGRTFVGRDIDCTPNMCPPPGNDRCSGARVIPPPTTTMPSVVMGSAQRATLDVGLPVCDDVSVSTPGVWYTVRGTGVTLTASTCDGTPESYNTRISVYCGNCDTFRCVAANNDVDTAECRTQSSVTWCAERRTTYFIFVHGSSQFPDDLRFTLTLSQESQACVPADPPIDCEIRGACCMGDGMCDELTREDCAADLGTYRGDDSMCERVTCPQPETCCFDDGSRQCLLLAACTSLGGTAPGLACGGLCPEPTGACCTASDCSVITRANCTLNGGEYQGNRTMCARNLCLKIQTTAPTEGTVDIRQPSDPDGMNPVGLSAVVLTLNGSVSALMASDLELTFAPPNPAMAPSILGVTGTGNVWTVTLSRPIPPGHWTRIALVASGSDACFGFLPADVLGDGTSDGEDAGELADRLAAFVPMSERAALDIDRNGMLNLFDLMRIIELLIGREMFIDWDGESIPASPCDP